MSYFLNLTASSPILTYWPDVAASGSASTGWTGWLGGDAGYATYGVTNWMELSGIQCTAFAPYFTSPSANYGLLYQIDSGTINSIALDSSGSSIALSSGSTSLSSHTIMLQVSCTASVGCDPSQPFVLEGIGVATSLVTTGHTASQATLDDSSTIINYEGFAAATNGSDVDAVQILQSSTVAASVRSTLSYTATSNATASVYFTGTSIQILGVTGPTMGSYNVLIDGTLQNPTPYDATSTVERAQVILGFFTGLTQGEHQFAITDLQGGLAIDGFVAYGSAGCCFGQGCTPSSASPAPTQIIPASPGSSISASVIVSPISSAGAVVVTTAALPGLEKSGPSAGTIVGAILGTLAALALLISLLVYKLHRDKEVKKPEISRWDANNVLAAQENQYVKVEPETGGLQGYTYPRQVAHTEFD